MPLHHEHIPGHERQPKKAEPKKDKAGKTPPLPPSGKVLHGAKQKDAAIDEGLQAIYGDDRSDLQRVERDRRSLTKILTKGVLVLAAIAALSYAGFFIYTTFFAEKQSDRPLVVTIEAPQDVKSGERVEVTIAYQNPRRTPLAALSLDVNLPTAFELTTADPQPTNPDDFEWTVGSLGPQSDGKIVLEGIWRTSVPSTTSIQVLAHYRPANFNADFSDIASASVTTIASTGTIELKGPEEATPGKEQSFEAVITNTGTEPLPTPGFELQLPTGFILSSSTPALTSDTPRWELPDIAPGAQTTVSWKGSFASDTSDVAQFTGKLLLTDESLDLAQASSDWFVDVANSNLAVTVVANGASDRATTSSGDVLRVTVRVENAGETDLLDTSILLDFQPENGVPIVWDDAVLAGGTLSSEGVRFPASVVGALAAGAKKSFSLSFPIEEVLGENAVDNWTITAFATQGDITVQTTPLAIQLNAAPDISSEARYFSPSNAPVGEGPLPPKVGQQTTYRFYWNIGASLHDLEDVEMSATLPPDIIWSDRVISNHGNVSYDEGSRTVRWSVNLLPAGEAGTAEFSLTATPGSEDVETFIKLLSAGSFIAKDAKTGASIASETAELTSELPNDAGAAGKGTVIAE